VSKNSKQTLVSDDAIDYSNVPSAANITSTKLYFINQVNRITEGDSQNGGSDLSQLFDSNPEMIYIPEYIRLGTGRYFADPRGPSFGRRPFSGQTYPRRKIIIGA